MTSSERLRVSRRYDDGEKDFSFSRLCCLMLSSPGRIR